MRAERPLRRVALFLPVDGVEYDARITPAGRLAEECWLARTAYLAGVRDERRTLDTKSGKTECHPRRDFEILCLVALIECKGQRMHRKLDDQEQFGVPSIATPARQIRMPGLEYFSLPGGREFFRRQNPEGRRQITGKLQLHMQRLVFVLVLSGHG